MYTVNCEVYCTIYNTIADPATSTIPSVVIIQIISELEEERDALEEKKEALENVQDKIDDIISQIISSARLIESHTCSEFISLVEEFTQSIEDGSDSWKTMISEIINAIVGSCTLADKENLETIKNTTIDQTNEVAEEIINITEEIENLESILAARPTTTTTKTTTIRIRTSTPTTGGKIFILFYILYHYFSFLLFVFYEHNLSKKEIHIHMLSYIALKRLKQYSF